MKSIASERLLSVRQVASRLGVSTSTVYNLCREGKLVHVRVSNSIRVEPGVLEHLAGWGSLRVTWSAGLLGLGRCSRG